MSRATRVPLQSMLLVALSACQSMANPGDPLQAVPVSGNGAVVAPANLTGPQGDFDFEGEDRPIEEFGEQGDGGLSDEDLLALQARANGLDPSDVTAPSPEPVAEAVAAAPMPAAMSIPEWDPAQPLAGGSWGVRLLATLHDVQPPRAVLGLPDGEEIVVQPGSFVENHRLVVIAVGRDVVQLSRITPQGFYAKVETETLQSLFTPTGAN